MGRRSCEACEGQLCERLAQESLSKCAEAGDVPWRTVRAVYMCVCPYVPCVCPGTCACICAARVASALPPGAHTGGAPATMQQLRGCLGPTLPHLHGLGPWLKLDSPRSDDHGVPWNTRAVQSSKQLSRKSRFCKDPGRVGLRGAAAQKTGTSVRSLQGAQEKLRLGRQPPEKKRSDKKKGRQRGH